MTSAYGAWQWGKGTYSAPINLVGDLAPGLVLSATMANPVLLSGDLPVMATVSDTTALLLLGLTGDLALQIDIDGLLGGTVAMGGDMPVNVALAAQMGSGPFWAASEPCAPVDWEEAELCYG